MMGMVRKQVYIEQSQEEALRRAARKTGMSQAELVRRGIEKGMADLLDIAPRTDTAWKKALKVMKARLLERGVQQSRRRWKRNDLYDR